MFTVIFCLGFVLVFIVIKLLEWAEGLSEYFNFFILFLFRFLLSKENTITQYEIFMAWLYLLVWMDGTFINILVIRPDFSLVRFFNTCLARTITNTAFFFPMNLFLLIYLKLIKTVYTNSFGWAIFEF